MNFATAAEAVAAFRAHRPMLEDNGVYWEPGCEPAGYAWDAAFRDYAMAMDAVSNVPTAATDPNSSIPSMLTTLVDPQVYEVLFAPNMAAEIMGEQKKGDWTQDTTIFPVAEATGETSAYGDYNNNGRAGVNVNYPSVQLFRYQLMKQYGDLELARMGLLRVNWVSEIDRSAALSLNKYANLVYFYGLTGLQTYGLINNPFLNAVLTPGTKAAGGTAWFTYTTGQANATANEVYNDILALYQQLVTQSAGLVSMDTQMTLALSPASQPAMNFTNTFGLTTEAILKMNFKNLTVKTAQQYGANSSTNQQGNPAGNSVQLIANRIEGQDTGFCAFAEKMRAFPVIRESSAYHQKTMSAVWGTVIRMPLGITGMVGI